MNSEFYIFIPVLIAFTTTEIHRGVRKWTGLFSKFAKFLIDLDEICNAVAIFGFVEHHTNFLFLSWF